MSHRSLEAILFAALCALSHFAVASTTISGNIRCANGGPPRMADVLVSKLVNGGVNVNFFFGNSLVHADVSAHGSFELTIDKPGYYELVITALDHEFLVIPLVINESDRRIEMSVQLEPLLIQDDAELYVIGSWNRFSLTRVDTMTRQPDGSYLLERQVSSDTVSYLIRPSLRPFKLVQVVNGTSADTIVRDGEWAYKCVIGVRDGHLRIAFDPNRYSHLHGNSHASVIFDKDHLFLTELFRAAQFYFQSSLANSVQYLRSERTHPGAKFSVNDSTVRAELLSLMGDKSRDSLVRQMAGVCLVQHLVASHEYQDLSKYSQRVLAMVPPASGMWSAGGQEPFSAVSMHADGTRDEQVLWQFVKENPERTIQGMALTRLVEKAKVDGDVVKQATIYGEAVSKYGDDPFVRMCLLHFTPETIKKRTIAVGGKLPAFDFSLLSGKEKISSSALEGRYYLLDFWAVWCGACVEELPLLQEIYAKYKGRRFTIISVALDSKMRVDTFLKTGHEMPWINAVVENEERQKTSALFEIEGLPRPILVDSRGKIVAMDSGARGKELERRLKLLLGVNEGTHFR